jgi:pilus assembly protein CpaE
MEANYQPHILIVDGESATSGIVRDILVNEGYAVEVVKSADTALAATNEHLPDLAIVEAILPGMDGHGLIRKFRENDKTRAMPILLMTANEDIADKIAGFQAGANDHIAKPFQPLELTYRVKGLLAHFEISPPTPLQARKQGGNVIAVFGTKGGVGKTTISVNLAVSLLRRTHARTALFDGDLFFGDAALLLNLSPSRTVSDLVEHINELDLELANQVLIPHSSGLRVLLSPQNPEKAEAITAQQMERLLNFLTQLYDYTVVDLSASYDDRTLTVLDRADAILLVVRPEVGTLKNMGIFLELAKKMGIPPDKLHIVLNRANSRSGIEAVEIERSFKRAVAFRITSGGRAVVVSANRGVPLILEQPNHPVSQQINKIGEYLVQRLPQPTHPESKLLTHLGRAKPNHSNNGKSPKE